MTTNKGSILLKVTKVWTMHPSKVTFCFLLCVQETSKSAKSSMKNNNSSGKDSAAENSDEVGPQHAAPDNLCLS